jgi:hypothetical protein
MISLSHFEKEKNGFCFFTTFLFFFPKPLHYFQKLNSVSTKSRRQGKSETRTQSWPAPATAPWKRPNLHLQVLVRDTHMHSLLLLFCKLVVDFCLHVQALRGKRDAGWGSSLASAFV